MPRLPQPFLFQDGGEGVVKRFRGLWSLLRRYLCV